MRTVPLQQICDIQIGKTPSRSVPEYWGGELPWVTIGDFVAGRTVTTTKERITRIGAEKSGSKRIPRGTLLLSFKLSLGKRTISGCDLFTNEASQRFTFSTMTRLTVTTCIGHLERLTMAVL